MHELAAASNLWGPHKSASQVSLFLSFVACLADLVLDRLLRETFEPERLTASSVLPSPGPDSHLIEVGLSC